MTTTRNVEAAKFLLMAALHREKVAARIKERRTELGLTQQDVADAANVTSNTVSRWERGKNLSREGNLERVAAALQTTVADLMAGIEPGRPAAASGPLELFSAADRGERLEAKVDVLLEQVALIAAALGVSPPELGWLADLAAEAGKPGGAPARSADPVRRAAG